MNTPQNENRNISEAKIRHLEMIQRVIERMANMSARIKGWTILVVSGFFALRYGTESASQLDGYISLLALLPCIALCALDVFYVRLEKQYRDFYNDTLGENDPRDLGMVAPENVDFKNRLGAARSFSIWPFYLPIAALIIITSF